MNKTVKILLPAGDIPIGSTVTKRTGDKEYTLQSEIKIRVFGDPTPQRESRIAAEKGTVMLVNGTDANVVVAEQELLWIVEPSRLADWLLDQERDGK